MGPNYSISTACATGNFCILNAANHITRGEAVSILHPLGILFMAKLLLFDTWLFFSLKLIGCNALRWL